MKIAICFSGQARSLNWTFFNLKDYLIDKLDNPDIFIHIAEDDSSSKFKNYLDKLDAKVLKIEKDEEINVDKLIHQQRNIKQYMNMINSWKKSNELRIQYQKEKNIKYDAVIRTRLDVRFFNPINLNEIKQYDLKNYVCVPDFHSFPIIQGQGTNDRFAIGSCKNITKYSNMIDYIFDYNLNGHRIHAESTLYYHLKQQNIKTKLIPVRFSRIREFGEEIDNRIRKNPKEWDFIDRGFYD